MIDKTTGAAMATLIHALQRTADCSVYPPAGPPVVGAEHVLPADLSAFYELCGGAKLFESADYAITIVPPQNVVLANPTIRRILKDDPDYYPHDISWSWYIIADTGDGQYLTIDLSRERVGRCYDSFWEIHAVSGSCAIIATSFTNLLVQLLANQGQYWYWLRPGFAALGDAYD